jgi:hypothetical protein
MAGPTAGTSGPPEGPVFALMHSPGAFQRSAATGGLSDLRPEYDMFLEVAEESFPGPANRAEGAARDSRGDCVRSRALDGEQMMAEVRALCPGRRHPALADMHWIAARGLNVWSSFAERRSLASDPCASVGTSPVTGSSSSSTWPAITLLPDQAPHLRRRDVPENPRPRPEEPSMHDGGKFHG